MKTGSEFVLRSLVMNTKQIDIAMQRLATQIWESFEDRQNICLVGIRTRGVPMALTLAAYLKSLFGIFVSVGKLDISLYRDDLTEKSAEPVSGKMEIDFLVREKHIILVDDVIFTGRTCRAAIDALLSLGRPPSIRMCALIDRGWREMPIQPDFVGKVVQTTCDEIIKVSFMETDEKQSVELFERKPRR